MTLTPTADIPWSTDWRDPVLMAYEIIPMSTGQYNPQYTTSKQGFSHWPPGFIKRCLSAKKTCAQTHAPWMPMFLSTWFQTVILNDTRKNGENICQLPASPPFIFSHWLRLQIFMESKGFVPFVLTRHGCHVLWYLEIHHAHSTLQYKDFNTYVEKTIHKIMQKSLMEDGKSDQKQSPKALTKKLWASTLGYGFLTLPCFKSTSGMAW